MKLHQKNSFSVKHKRTDNQILWSKKAGTSPTSLYHVEFLLYIYTKTHYNAYFCVIGGVKREASFFYTKKT